MFNYNKQLVLFSKYLFVIFKKKKNLFFNLRINKIENNSRTCLDKIYF